MSGSIPLEVIYSRQEESQSYPSFISQSTAAYLDEETLSFEVPADKKKKRKTGCCAKMLLCCWCMFVLTCFVLTVGSLFMGYAHLHGCFHSNNYELTSMITDAKLVNEIKFDIVTGAVFFGVNDGEGSDIIVSFYRSARDSEMLDGISRTLELNEGVLNIASVSPAFDMNSCQYAYVEVLFPSSITKEDNTLDISITGSIKAGYVEMSDIFNLKDVVINVDLGIVEMGIMGANSLEIQGGLAYVDIDNFDATQYAKIAVETGSIQTRFVSAPEFEAKAVYGSSWNSDVQTNKATVQTKYGYATVLRPTHLASDADQTVEVKSYYGKAIATYDSIYNVDFTVTGEHGDIAVMYEDVCELDEEKSNDDLLTGTCSSPNLSENLNLSKTSVSVSVTYGNSIFLQQESEELSYLEDDYEESEEMKND